MKCSNCGMELREGSVFCDICGAPVEGERTVLADDDHVYIRSDGRYAAESRPHERYDRGYGRGGSPRGGKTPGKKQRMALIISVVAFMLVLGIVVSLIAVLNNGTVSAAELEDAREKFLPPADAITIDTSLIDPSNDNIKFTYDSRARITSCTYKANNKTYDQRYTYNDAERRVNIETRYRKRPIFTKDIEYDRVTEPGIFEAIDGYYLRLDEQSLTVPETIPETAVPETATPKSTSKPKPTSKPTEKPTTKPTEKPTTKPTEKPTTVPTVPQTEAPTQEPTSADDHAGNTIVYNGHTYQVFDSGMTWNEARAFCESKGGYLACITSQEEQTEVFRLVQSGEKNNYWLGGFKSGDSWSWISGESFSYSNWAPNQPDDYTGEEDSLLIYRIANKKTPGCRAGQWNDLCYDCTCYSESFFGKENFGFVCEWDS